MLVSISKICVYHEIIEFQTNDLRQEKRVQVIVLVFFYTYEQTKLT